MFRVVFDTIIYRKIGQTLKNKTEIQKIEFKKSFFKKEQDLGYTPMLNMIVFLELVNHLKDDCESQSYKDCKEGLLFAIDHAPNESSFLCEPVMYYCKSFFNHASLQDVELLQKIGNFIKDFRNTKGIDTKISELKDNIIFLSDQHKILEKIWIHNIEMSIKSAGDINRENIHGIFTGKQYKKHREELEKALKIREPIYKNLAISFFELICNLSRRYFADENAQEQILQNLISNHKAAFEKIVIKNSNMIGQQNVRIDSDKNINDISDIMIMFSIDPSLNIKFVTEEIKNIECFKNVGLQDSVMKQDAYFKLLNLNSYIVLN